jgi:hypothetical protein
MTRRLPFEIFGPLKGDPALGNVPGVFSRIEFDLHDFNCSYDKSLRQWISDTSPDVRE